MAEVTDLTDPRVFPPPDAAAPAHARVHALAADALAASTRQEADGLDVALRGELTRMLAADGAALAALFASAPSVAVTRHLWRLLDATWRDNRGDASGLSLLLFAIPVVVVTGGERGAPIVHDGVLADRSRLVAILREHAALGGSQAFALSAALVSAESIDLARLPELSAWQRLPESAGPGAELPPRALTPSPLLASGDGESVHLRFVVGSTLARTDADPFAGPSVGPWGVPFTRELSRQLAVGSVSVLALPRAPQRPLPAVATGRAAQREVGAQLFAGNAIRKLRAAAGEPTAVISAHRAPDAPGGGELRLSLSSPFAPRDAEGFRCPLYPLDRVVDVATMLTDLVSDCRVTDVRVAPGVHPDRDPATGRALLFKPDTLPGPAAVH
jgi:hypothetical protein